ncbi:MAG: acetyltransferase [Candidatus Thiothrix sulfatifontis]|nr:MAG: acetyltransferase [Candidatus Thiothrix sulfatifontis]
MGLSKMILFGVRSPLVVEYEETCHRLGLKIEMAVSVNGSPRLVDQSRVVNINELPPSIIGKRFIACAFTPSRRAALIAQAQQLGFVLDDPLIDPSAILARSVRIGEGSFINAGVVVGAVSMIGNGVLVNRAVSLGHHTVLGDYVSIGPGATLAGNIHIGAGTMIGAGATILPDIRIGENALIAAGSVVRKHVPDGVLVVGNPAQERSYNPAKSSLYVEDGE